MLTKIQGLVLNKTPFQERNLVVKLLLRSGKKASVLFYGGRGGGAKMKSSSVELGHMMDVELRPGPRSSQKDLVVAKEWLPMWAHKRIRHEYRAFALMCLFLEITERVALDMDWSMADAHEEALPQGPFRVLSNALFHIESDLEQGCFSANRHLMVFTGKLLAELGVYPQRGECVLCGDRLDIGHGSLLLPEKGGMACLVCMGIGNSAGQLDNENLLSAFLERLWHGKYGDMLKFLEERTGEQETKVISKSLVNYLMYQFHWESSSFKSLQQL